MVRVGHFLCTGMHQRITLQKYLEIFPSGVCPRFFTSAESRKGQGRPPFTFTSFIFSSRYKGAGCYLSCGRKQAIKESFGSKVNASSQSHFFPLLQQFLQVFPCLSRVFLSPAPHQCPLGKGDTLGKKLLLDNEEIAYALCI